jgi:hypothetical protein
MSSIIDDLTDKKTTGNKVLLILYYNGHYAVKEGKLIWSA